MATREKGYALCVENRGAEDLEIRKVYRVLHDKGAALPATRESSTSPVKTTSTRLTISSPSSCRRRRSVPGRRIEASPSDGARRTSRSSGPELALLAPAAERRRSAGRDAPPTAAHGKEIV